MQKHEKNRGSKSNFIGILMIKNLNKKAKKRHVGLMII
jgi:hypothetical protein